MLFWGTAFSAWCHWWPGGQEALFHGICGLQSQNRRRCILGIVRGEPFVTHAPPAPYCPSHPLMVTVVGLGNEPLVLPRIGGEHPCQPALRTGVQKRNEAGLILVRNPTDTSMVAASTKPSTGTPAMDMHCRAGSSSNKPRIGQPHSLQKEDHIHPQKVNAKNPEK